MSTISYPYRSDTFLVCHCGYSKVPEEAGGTQSGLLVQFDCEADEIDTVLDNMVDWISMRMEVSIPNYSTQLHSLTLLEEADLCTGACDLDDKELLNASLEFE